MFEETPIEEQLDWGTDSAGDDQSDLDDEIAESAGLDTGMYHTSHLYDDDYTDCKGTLILAFFTDGISPPHDSGHIPSMQYPVCPITSSVKQPAP